MKESFPIGIKTQYSLKNSCSLKVGGSADYYIAPNDVEELREAVVWAQEKKLEITILGDGTNILISDKGIRGLVISDEKFSKIEQIHIDEKNSLFQLQAQSGTPKSKLMRAFLKEKLSPALFLSGLPGRLGGGIVMNAGVSEDRKPKEFCEIVDWFEVLEFKTLKIKKYLKEEIKWSYRSSKGYDKGFILRAGLSWPLKPDLEIPPQVVSANKLRLSKQPLDLPSCGSVFKNPTKELSAGRLIDECGLKGYQVGGAQISDKHANFIVNREGKAKAQDIYDIINHIKATVKTQKGIDLTPEVKFIGDW